MFKKLHINYFFFSVWFLILFAFSFLHISNVQNKLLFITHSFAQILLEISVFCIALSLLEKFSRVQKFFSGLLFFILFFHILNLFMVKLMDTSIAYALKMIFGDGLQSLLLNLEAMDINYAMLFCVIITLFLLPVIGGIFYHYSNKVSQKKPFYISIKTFFIVFLTLIAIEFSCEKIAIQKDFNSYLSYKNRLPLTETFLSSSVRLFPIKNFKRTKSEAAMAELLSKKNLSLKKSPNIFIFVIESFRKDAINAEATPTLQKFKEKNIFFNQSFSAANGSHLSWFSIFYSHYPLSWNHYQKNWKNGSTPLKILKSLDYKIKVFSSADLAYFDMDKTLFGEKRQLADEFTMFEEKKSHERDFQAFEKLKKSIDGKTNKNLFVVFLDSTHSEYNYPKNILKFGPTCQSINYFDFLFSKRNLPLLKNRYLNSVNYLDDLFKDFFEHLKKNNMYEDSIIVLTADHGEEFYEDGSLFHGTHLNEYQTNVPILYKIPHNEKPAEKITSQVDIFPTILHYLTGRVDFDDLLDGQSIFHPYKKNFSITGSQNGKNAPKEFVIHDGEKKIIAHLDGEDLKVTAFQDRFGNDLQEKIDEKSFDVFIEK